MATRFRATRPLYRSLKKGGKGMKIPLWDTGHICQGLAPRTAKLLLEKGWVEAVEDVKKEAEDGA